MFAEIKRCIDSCEKIGIVPHINPDGDALGSAYALKIALISLQKNVEVFLDSEVDTKEFSLICDETSPSTFEISDCDLVIAVDCAELNRIGKFEYLFSSKASNTAAFDHHITHKHFATKTALNADAASTGELIYEFLKFMNVSIDHRIANNLYISIVSDTGGFKYASTTERTLCIAADLIKHVNAAKINKILFDTVSFGYLEIMKIALNKLEFYCDGKLIILQLNIEDFKNAGTDDTEADPIINFIRSINGVEVCVYIKQKIQNYKVSMRSNAYVNIAKIATELGGGGHIRAGGFVSAASPAQIKSTLITRLSKEF